ncbi:hypothetical protein SDJN02_04712, partial [Cucurbita argyrosperma subsp. argyrosperma]
MGFLKEEKSKRLWRGIKTLFVLITMLISLLLFSAPVLLVIADALLSASLYPYSFSLNSLPSHLKNYDFRSSLIDIPLISFARSAIIICVYSFCDGPRLSRGPLRLCLMEACRMSVEEEGMREAWKWLCLCALWLWLLDMSLWRIERVAERGGSFWFTRLISKRSSACNSGFPRYQKILQEERVKFLGNDLKSVILEIWEVQSLLTS